MNYFPTDTQYRWSIGSSFLPSKRFLFLAWQGRSSEVEVKSLVFYFFSKIFKGLKKIFHFGEKKFSTKRKINLDRSKLQYFPISTRVLAKKYWKTAEKIYTSPLTLLQKFTVSLIQCIQSAIPDLFTAICRENAL